MSSWHPLVRRAEGESFPRSLLHRPRERVALWRLRLIEAWAGREEEFTAGDRLISGRLVRPLRSHLLTV